MKLLLLTSAGWEESPIIAKELVKLVDKKPSEIKILVVVTPIKYLKRNKYIKKLFKKIQEIKILKENLTFLQLDKSIFEKSKNLVLPHLTQIDTL